jgi:hypothetical protein
MRNRPIRIQEREREKQGVANLTLLIEVEFFEVSEVESGVVFAPCLGSKSRRRSKSLYCRSTSCSFLYRCFSHSNSSSSSSLSALLASSVRNRVGKDMIEKADGGSDPRGGARLPAPVGPLLSVPLCSLLSAPPPPAPQASVLLPPIARSALHPIATSTAFGHLPVATGARLPAPSPSPHLRCSLLSRRP